MKISELSIKNFRALRDVKIPLSSFGCLIGENNAGKSSILQALALFYSGTKLDTNNFFDESKPIRIAVTFDGIADTDLARLAEVHRTRMTEIVKDGRLILVRIYDNATGKSLTMRYTTLIPNDTRFLSERVDALLKGVRAGQALVDKVVQTFPELNSLVDKAMNKEAVSQKIQEVADAFPDDQKVAVDKELPTGMDKSIVSMLPEPIYIPAVKDLSDDIKTTESTSFGKILAILLKAIESRFPDVQQHFEDISKKLNRVLQADGTFVDDRFDEVKLIETTVEKYVRESFADVALRLTIPPPELKTIFTSTRIYVNDGVEGVIDSKGDGLRRAIVLSILRSYVELKETLAPAAMPLEEATNSDATAQLQVNPARASYFLLFEEPELFLHPKAQHILFDTLRVFSNEHHVLVTTHSPMFFGPGTTETFVKLRKVMDATIASKPFTRAQPVDLLNMNARDQFQIICFENNNAAFFADTVVLVEGDSDYLLMPHIARTLNHSWDVNKVSVVFARITGKGNIRRYREFFAKFGVRVPVIADLDILVNGFEHIDPNSAVKIIRDQLLKTVDDLIVQDGNEPSAKDAKDAHDSGELRGLWRRVKEAQTNLKDGVCSQEEHDEAVEAFFAWARKSERLEVLKANDDSKMIRLKHNLLEMLRKDDVYVLERGAIEQYYPPEIIGADKPSRAQDFCSKVTSRDAILSCCNEQTIVRGGAEIRIKEFDLIFRGIFDGVFC
jgi:putative ATP-dependent endonuclease of the OLD family